MVATEQLYILLILIGFEALIMNAPLRREKDGCVTLKTALHPMTLFKILPLCDRLNVGRTELLHAKDVALILREVQNFMDISFGLHSPTPRAFVKLPHSLFIDYSPEGSTELIVRTTLEFMLELGWKALDLTSGDFVTKRREEGLSLLIRLEAILKQKGHLKRPIFYFPSTLRQKDVLEFTQVVTALGGSVVNTAEQATHMIVDVPDIESILAITVDFVQPLDVRLAPQALGQAWVHWWYYPLCYDEWVSQLDVGTTEAHGEHPEHPPGGASLWKVNSRFLRDAMIFNEWGKESDYLIEEGDGENSKVSDKTQDKAVSDAPGTVPLKKKARKGKNKDKDTVVEGVVGDSVNLDAAVLFAPRGGIRPGDANPVVGALPGATDKAYSDARAPTDPFNRETQGNVQVAMVLPMSLGSEDEEVEILPVAPIAAQPQVSDSLTYQALVPRGAPSWYTPARVCGPELQFLSALLGLSPSAEQIVAYVRIREHMVATYSVSPMAYLSATDARRRVAADAAFAVKVHEFLDAHQVINWQVLPENIPQPRAPCANTPSLISAVSTPETAAWDEAWDLALLTQLRSYSAIGVKDWMAVAAAVSERVCRSVTPTQCMTRFAQMDQAQLAAAEQSGARGLVYNPARAAALSSRLLSGRLAALAAQVSELGEGGLPKPAPTTESSSSLAPLQINVNGLSLSTMLTAVQARIDLIKEVEQGLTEERSRIEVDRRDALQVRSRVAAFSEYRA